MRILRLFLLLLALLLPKPCAVAADQGYRFDQEANSLGKVVVSYSTNKAIRIDIPRMNSVLVMKAPTWRVSLFSNEKHNIFESEADNFGGQLRAAQIVSLVSAPLKDIVVKYNRDGQYKGIAAKLYSYSPTKEQKQDGTERMSAEYWVSKIAMPTRAAHAVEKLYNVPFVDGMPLAFLAASPNGFRGQLLTTQFFKAHDFPADTFNVPTGYRSSKTVLQYWNTAVGTEQGSAGLLEMISPKK